MSAALPEFTEPFHASYLLGKAEAEARSWQARALEAESLLEHLGEALNLSLAALERIGQIHSSYFEEARAKILEAIMAWDMDNTIPVCLACGSPSVQWVEWSGGTGVFAPDGYQETATDWGWRCSDCGAVEETTGERKVA